MFKSRDDYRGAWDRAYEDDPPIPLNIDIELASLCNLACPFCFYGEASWNDEMEKAAEDGKPKKRFMPADMAFLIIQQAAALGVPALKFNWRGESTMHPQYAEILQFASQMRRIPPAQPGLNGAASRAFHDMLVNTNANCKPEAVNGLMFATKVMVSLDSLVPETYSKMRVNGNLDRAIEVVRELIRRRHPNVWVRRVITLQNQDENFAGQARAMFGPDVHISEHACFDRNTDERHQTNGYEYDRTYCGYPSQRMMIASDGTVFPCCVDYDGTMPMGKFPHQNIFQIWHGDRFRTLRSELRGNTFKSKACANCTSWMAYKAPERSLVQDKEIKV